MFYVYLTERTGQLDMFDRSLYTGIKIVLFTRTYCSIMKDIHEIVALSFQFDSSQHHGRSVVW